jgi:hypothetical protein
MHLTTSPWLLVKSEKWRSLLCNQTERMKMPFFCFAVIFSFSVHAQTKDTTLYSILRLRNGETHTVTITHTKTKTEKGKQPTSTTVRYAALLTVIDSTQDEYTYKWVYQASQGSDPASKAMGGYIDGLTLTYKTDEMGSFKELQNWEALRDFYIKTMMDNLPPDRRDSALLQKTLALFNSKKMVETAFIKEIRLLHTTHGQRFSTQGTKQAVLLPTPLTKDPIPATLTSRVTAVHTDSFVVTSKQTIDKKASLKMLQQMFQKMGLSQVLADKEAQAALASVHMSDESQFTIRRADGLPLKSVYRRTGEAAGVMQVETYSLVVE